MKIERELLKGIAPLAVMELLSHGAMYGYQLSELLSQRSGELLSLGRGTLYPLLYNLEAKGWVKSTERESESGRTRRYYVLTAAGKKRLREQRAQWEQLQEGMGRVFGNAQTPAYAGGMC